MLISRVQSRYIAAKFRNLYKQCDHSTLITNQYSSGVALTMKKFATMIAFVALFALFAISASALQINSATIGDDDQDRVKNASQTFTVTNNESSTVSVTMASTADSKYNVRFEPTLVNLTAGQSTTVKVIADIPLDFHAVEASSSASDFMEEKAPVIGQIQGKISGSVAASADLKLQAANQLKIKKARLECGDKTESLDDGDKVENLKPDMKCSLEVEVENNFAENDDKDSSGNKLKIGDIEFDTVDIQVKVDDSDFDVDEDADLDGLDADDKDSASVDFDIDEDVDDGTFTMDVFVSGRDDNGATHGEHWEIRMEVERLTHDVQIRSPSISPLRISACDGGELRVTSRVANFGKRDEDEVAVELSIPDLKFTKRITDIQLDQDDGTSVNFVADVPADSKAGVYRATLSTFFDNTAPSNAQALEFTVDKCEEEQSVTTTEQQTDTTQTGQTSTTTQTGQTASTSATNAVAVPRARTSSTGFTESSGYLWLLGGLGVVMLAIIVVLLVVAFRKPKQDMM